ncbi:hypothetical protein [Mariniflexile sp.]|uniref:hypothetical protein n=1 Tax=Mariniflexile sp. TaxID=1979402 RepID=UPI003567F6BB
MKKLLYASVFLFATSIYAQEPVKNISEESTIKTVKTNNGSEIVEKKIKVTTRQEQGIEFAEKDIDKRDKDVVNSPVKITKTIEVDGDKGNSYESKTEIAYYEFEGKQYGFKKVDNGFSVLSTTSELPEGNIVKLNKSNHYIYQNGDDTGVGYFNEDGSFTIEYFDKKTGAITSQTYTLRK